MNVLAIINSSLFFTVKAFSYMPIYNKSPSNKWCSWWYVSLSL